MPADDDTRRATGILEGPYGHHRVVAQLVVIHQILIAEGDPEDPLTNQPRHRVLDQIGVAVIGETAGKAIDQPDVLISGTEQHRPGLRGHLATVKRGHHFPTFDGCKTKQIRATLCLHRDSPGLRDKPFWQHDFLRSSAPMHLPP